MVKDSQRLDRSNESLANSLGSMALKFIGVATAADAAYKSIVFTIAQASEAEQIERRLGLALATQGVYRQELRGALNDQADALAKVTLHTDEAIRAGMTQALQMGVAAGRMKEVTEAAVGLSGRLGVDLPTAFVMLGQAYNGHTRGLRRMGVSIDETRGTMAQFDQVLRFGKEGMAAAKGELDTTAGAWVQFKKSVADAAEEVGKRLNPVLEKLLLLMKLMPDAIKDIATADERMQREWGTGPVPSNSQWQGKAPVDMSLWYGPQDLGTLLPGTSQSRPQIGPAQAVLQPNRPVPTIPDTEGGNEIRQLIRDLEQERKAVWMTAEARQKAIKVREFEKIITDEMIAESKNLVKQYEAELDVDIANKRELRAKTGPRDASGKPIRDLELEAKEDREKAAKLAEREAQVSRERLENGRQLTEQYKRDLDLLAEQSHAWAIMTQQRETLADLELESRYAGTTGLEAQAAGARYIREMEKQHPEWMRVPANRQTVEETAAKIQRAKEDDQYKEMAQAIQKRIEGLNAEAEAYDSLGDAMEEVQTIRQLEAEFGKEGVAQGKELVQDLIDAQRLNKDTIRTKAAETTIQNRIREMQIEREAYDQTGEAVERSMAVRELEIANGKEWVEEHRQLVDELVRQIQIQQEWARTTAAEQDFAERIRDMHAEREAIGRTNVETQRTLALREIDKTYTREWREAHQGLVDTYLQEVETSVRYQEQMELAAEIQQDLVGGIMGMVRALAEGGDAWQAMGNMAVNALERIMQKQLESMITAKGVESMLSAVFSAIPGVGWGNPGSGGSYTSPTSLPPAIGALEARGDVFHYGSVIPFASGGVLGGPTLFPMIGNRMGLAGEAGPEGILPLKRGRSGKLGVEVTSETQKQTPVIVQSPGVKIVNVLDSSVVSDFMGSAAGEKLVMNIMRRNRGVLNG